MTGAVARQEVFHNLGRMANGEWVPILDDGGLADYQSVFDMTTTRVGLF